MRLSEEELARVREKYHVDELWSYSRLDTFRISPYLFFLKYVKHEQPKKDMVSPYGIIGGAVHTVLEKYYKGDIQYKDMLEEFQNEYATQIELFELKFNNSDEKLNESISRKYKADLEHFFSNYVPVPGKHWMEQFVSLEVQPGVVIQGYIDDTVKEEDGSIHLYDFKTSSISGYRGDRLIEHSHQLVLYAEALRQKNVPEDKIKLSFNMLKYVNVDIEQKNGSIKTSTIERCQIGEKLQTKASMCLKNFGYSEEEMNTYLADMLTDNSIEGLPDEVKAKFVIKDCYIDVPNPFEIYKDLKLEIIDIVSEIDNRKHEYAETHDDKVWYDDEELIKEQMYFHLQLSDYAPQQHKPLWIYLEKLEKEEEEKKASMDLLGVTKKTESGDDDLSWIDNII